MALDDIHTKVEWVPIGSILSSPKIRLLLKMKESSSNLRSFVRFCWLEYNKFPLSKNCLLLTLGRAGNLLKNGHGKKNYVRYHCEDHNRNDVHVSHIVLRAFAGRRRGCFYTLAWASNYCIKKTCSIMSRRQTKNKLGKPPRFELLQAANWHNFGIWIQTAAP